MMPTSNRKGMALPMALGAIVIIGGLISAAVYVSTQDYRIASNTARESQAIAVAEYGLNRVLQEWQPSLNLTMVTGDTLKRSYTVNGGTAAGCDEPHAASSNGSTIRTWRIDRCDTVHGQ